MLPLPIPSDARQPSVSVYWVLWTSYGISRASYRPLAGSVQPHRLIMWVFPSLYVRTDPYGSYGTRRIHLRVIASMWPKYTRTPIDHPYSSDRKRVISYGLRTGYRSVRLSKPHLETEGLKHIAPRVAWTIPKTIYQLGQHTRTLFPTNIKIKGEKLACCPIWQHQTGNTDYQTPFILTTLYIHVHVAILAAQFLFFFKFLNTRCWCASTKRYFHLKSGEDKTLNKIIFLLVSWTFLPSSEYNPKIYIGKTSCDSDMFSDILGKSWKFENYPLWRVSGPRYAIS